MGKFILTCDPGLEEIVKLELEEKVKSAKFLGKLKNLQGKVLVEAKSSKKLFSLRSIHHIAKLISYFQISSFERNGLEEIALKLSKINFSKLLKNKKSFRVTSQRIGTHSFTSIEVQKVAGKVIQEKYKLRVDLKNFDVNVRVDVFGKDVFISSQLTKESLYKRFKLPFVHPAAIKSTIAYGLIRIAEVKEGETVLDPMCGGGTIILELADLFRNKVKIFGSDINKKFINGALENAKANKLEKFIEFKVIDATKLEEAFPEKSIDKIITDLPYGIRVKDKNLKALYEKFLVSCYKVLKDSGRIVALTLRADSFRALLFKIKKFKIVEEKVIESGGLYPHIFVLEKL
ncbi:MAG: THUMP domain-containing protein [Candidatus Aenigmarchaeota archaeon]|nr:THUMP domain-containing protein [Candidatus Aenigmarchaeota archaeon]